MTDWFSDLLFWIIFGAILFLLRRQKIFLDGRRTCAAPAF